MSRHEVVVGEEEATKTCSRLVKSKKATDADWAAISTVMKHLKCALQIKPNHQHLSGDELPGYVWEKVSGCDRLLEKARTICRRVGREDWDRYTVLCSSCKSAASFDTRIHIFIHFVSCHPLRSFNTSCL